ncbi:hypothetical protein BGZ59_010472 [Podila verticillata]|nr:hypothetical protein BGZ59_010472 [Podila verticillata]KFH64906.1 arf/Sar family protein [Podila verticillata NRRL 6337]
MGIPVSKLFASLYAASLKKDFRILILGLEAAGKTTFLYKLKLGEVITTIPTISFNVETVTYKNICFTMCDVNGRQRPLWRHYFKDCAGIIFVVDSSDRDRIDELKYEMQILDQEDELNDAVFLIIANKQDLPGCMTVIELYEALGLFKLEAKYKRNFHVQPCSVIQGDGLREGLEWLSRQLMKSPN